MADKIPSDLVIKLTEYTQQNNSVKISIYQRNFSISHILSCIIGNDI